MNLPLSDLTPVAVTSAQHGSLSRPAQLAVAILAVVIPALWITFALRLRTLPGPKHFALLFALAVLAGVLLAVPAVSIVAVAALLALGLAWLYAHYSLRGISYQRSLESSRFFAGDEGQLVTRLCNRKLLPLGWLTITDPIHLDVAHRTRKLAELLEFSEGVEHPRSERFEAALVSRDAVGAFGELVRTYRVTALQRGVYALGPVQLESGDPFGIFRREASLGGRQEIVVYPRVYRPDEIDPPFQEALGEWIVRRALLEDPTLIAGSREYRPGDPLRRVEWKATARRGELQVRVADPSTTAKVMIVLNLTTFRRFWEGIRTDRLEEAIRAAGSLAVWALESGFAVGLHSNAILADQAGDKYAPRVPPSAHPRQKAALLEHLARLVFAGNFSPAYILLEEARKLTEGTSLIFVTTLLTPQLVSVLTSRQLAGKVAVVYCGSPVAPVVRGLPMHLFRPEARRAAS